MQKRFDNVLNKQGNALQGCVVTVKTYPALALASIYVSNGSDLIGGSYVTTDANGYYEYYAADGRYTEIVSGPGITTYTVNDISIEDSEADFTALAASSGSSLVGFIQSGTGATATTLEEWARQFLPSILDFIPVALHAGIKARTDTTDLSSYITAAYAEYSSFRWPAGRYYTASSINLTAIYGAGIVGDSWSDGITDDWNQTEIVINATNTPGLMVYGPVRLENFIIGYAAQQTTANTSSRTIEFNNLAYASLRNLKAKYGNTNYGIKQANFGASGANYMFSSDIQNVYSFSASETHYDFRNFTGGGTNCRLGPLYINGGGSSDFVTPGQSANYGIRGANWSGYELSAVSVDGVEIVEQVLEGTNLHFTADTFRMEAVTYKNDNDGWIKLGGGDGSAHFGYVELKNCRGLLADVPTATYLFRVNATKSYTNIGTLRTTSDCTFTSAVNRGLTFASTDAASEFHLRNFNNSGSGMSSTAWTDSSSLVLSPIKTWNGSAVASSNKQGNSTVINTVDYNTAAPTTGTWTVGSVRYNSGPAVGEPLGWLCVVAGTPGTWAAFGAVPLVNNTAVGNVGAGEDDLCTVTLPASMMINASSGIRITAWGTGANNANAKTLKLYFGTQIILTTALTINQVDTWRATATVWRTGASAQDWESMLVQAGTASLVDVENGTATQTETATISIKCTGDATTNNDIVQEGLVVELLR